MAGFAIGLKSCCLYFGKSLRPVDMLRYGGLVVMLLLFEGDCAL